MAKVKFCTSEAPYQRGEPREEGVEWRHPNSKPLTGPEHVAEDGRVMRCQVCLVTWVKMKGDV
jgi:hypothetical protein